MVAARSWSVALPFVSPVVATNLFAAAATAAACAILGALIAGWTRDRASGIAAGLAAGVSSSVWLNATETEVYAAALLLSVLMLQVADRAGRAPSPRRSSLLGYLFALAPPVHLSALVSAPAAIVLAATPLAGRPRRTPLVLGAAAMCLAAGVGTVSPWFTGIGIVLLAVAIVRCARAEPGGRLTPVATLGALALGASALVILLIRARHDPWIDQGNPATLHGLLDVVGRRQYVPAPPWPRQAPWWLQLGNIVQYADWQFALGLDDAVGASPWRMPFTLIYGTLAIVGGAHHARVDRRSWRVMLVLLLSATIGVAAYLNLKAGPSYGYGIVSPDAHEARERDYFFALGFAAWGAWAGMGAVAVSRRLVRGRHGGGGAIGVLVAALPIATNWGAMDRHRAPDAALARTLGLALLASAPRDAVLFAAGDNDSYPLWYLQTVEGVRRDVTPITTALLGAGWYRAELARRFALYDARDTAQWRGLEAEMRDIATHASRRGRPIAVSSIMTAKERSVIARVWDARGLVFVARDGAGQASAAVDSAVTRAVAALIAGRLGTEWPAPGVGDTQAARYAATLLRCPAAILESVGGRLTDPALDSICNLR